MSTEREFFVYLASRSPRRRELLEQIGQPYRRLADGIDVDEAVHAGEAPRHYVERVTRDKAAAGWDALTRGGLEAAPVLAADTTVVVGGRILGKPEDTADATRMLSALSDTTHEVLSAIALRFEDRVRTALSVSTVTFRALAPEEITAYIASGEPQDKAGAYGIQGRAAQFIVRLEGSYSGVMGLPLYETARLIGALQREVRAALEPLAR